LKWLYENNEDNSARYVLGTKGDRPLVCIGINPSTAEPDKLDRTLQSVARISEFNGYNSWIMINIYPQRSTNPQGLDIQRDYTISNENLVQIDKIFNEYNPTIWAAWGTNIKIRPYLINCLHEIVALANKHQCNWVECGNSSKEGHPHHPLYLSKTCIGSAFDLKSYLKNTAIQALFSYINIKDIKPFTYGDFYQLVEYSEFIDYEYSEHLSTKPACIEQELKMLKSADLIFMKALLTAILREDHFDNGSFERRLEAGEVARVLRKLKSAYLNC
jgi:hypothetical protein